MNPPVVTTHDKDNHPGPDEADRKPVSRRETEPIIRVVPALIEKEPMRRRTMDSKKSKPTTPNRPHPVVTAMAGALKRRRHIRRAARDAQLHRSSQRLSDTDSQKMESLCSQVVARHRRMEDAEEEFGYSAQRLGHHRGSIIVVKERCSSSMM